MNNHNFDMYYDSAANRSPNSQRQESLQRQLSRNQFDAPYGHHSGGLYTADDHSANFNGNRFSDMRNATVGGYGSSFDMGGQGWNPGAFPPANHTLNGLGGANLRKPPSRGGRAGLPSAWFEPSQSRQVNSFIPGFGGLGGQQMPRQDVMNSEPDEELIPTAIVIKNIPFAVKKEQLVTIMTDMGLPLPYAFNYHFDNGVFRGLAFANFTNPEETAAVIDSMNHLELNGRKLRVEYKKMLPAAERERIEREKRERRGQLEEQHRPMVAQTLQTQASASSLGSRILNASSPSPISARAHRMGLPFSTSPADAGFTEVDLNDPQALQFYSKLLLFKEDLSRDLIVFPPTLTPPERRIVHTLSHHMGLGHASKGESDHRAVHVFKEPRQRVSPSMQPFGNMPPDQKRGLGRAATTDFSDVRANDNYYGNANLRQQTSAFLGSGGYDSSGLGANNPLRSAKSFADLRSYTPSPVPSTASFPAALSNNVARLQEFPRDGAQSNTPALMTPTSALTDRGEPSQLINGLGNMTLGPAPGFGAHGSPRALRGFPSWDRENPGPIGSHRSFSTNFDAQSRGSAQPGGPERQPRGPIPERGSGFLRNRQNGHASRNSDELSQQGGAAEIAVEH